MRRALFPVLVLASAAIADGPEPTTVPVGVTELLRAGRFEIGYCYFDRESVRLGSGWTGFDEASGVYWIPEAPGSGLEQVFAHCPWRGGTGVTFADCVLGLPVARPIRLRFDIGLRPTAKGTDGVTYRVKAGGKTLFDRHCTWKEFRTFEADLTEFSGRTVTLRLEVGPGPARRTTDDWSLWRSVRVVAGTQEQLAAAEKRARSEAAARRARTIRQASKLADVSLLPLTTATSDSVCPGVLAPTKVMTRRDGDTYVFECRGTDETIEYRFRPEGGLLSGVSVAVNGRVLSPSPFAGGPTVHLDGCEFRMPKGTLATRLASVRPDGPRLRCEYVYTDPETGADARLQAVLWPEGKSLGLEVRGEADRFAGFVAQPFGGRPVATTFAADGPPTWRPEGVYVATVADLMRSEASSVHRGRVVYAPLTNGRRHAMRDVFYLTVTSRYEEVLGNLTHAPSPYLDDLARRVVLDAWGGDFAWTEGWLTQMAVYGVDGLLVIKHVWQRDGYDRSYPNTIPANAAMGGDAGLRRLSLAAQRLGHRFCVHENYYDYYPNAEAFDQADCALGRNGKTVRGWDRGPVAAVILKPSKLMDYVRRFTPEIRRRYQPNAAYHDIMPTWHVDYDAKVSDAGKIRITHEGTRELCDYDRKIFDGPVVFEADSQRLAGVFDGGCNHGVDMVRHPPAVAYELLKVHPKMSNHGFGYYERWLPWGYGAGWNSYVMTDRELDRYRATVVAFGRTGFIGQQLMKHPHGVVREFYLMRAFGRAYTGKRAQRIRYRVNGTWIDAGTAARLGELARLHVEYEGGQHVYVNLADEPWDVAEHTLPPAGCLTTGPRSRASTALHDGQIADFAQYDDLTYVDARSHQWLPPEGPPPIEPSVAVLKHLAGTEFELTVHWKVGRKLDRDFTVFWHFTTEGGRIAFQADHAPATPTSTWPVGKTIVDGPKRLSINVDGTATRYDIVVGLYDRQGRASLVGGAGSVRIGRLNVTRDGDVARAVSLDPTPLTPVPGSDRAPYLRDANGAKRVIDFGELATNGAAVVHRTARGGTIVPVPRGQVFMIGIAGMVESVTTVDASGEVVPSPALVRRDGKTWFETTSKAGKYTWRRGAPE